MTLEKFGLKQSRIAIIMAGLILSAGTVRIGEAQAQSNENSCRMLANKVMMLVDQWAGTNFQDLNQVDPCTGAKVTVQKAFLRHHAFGGSRTIYPSGAKRYHIAKPHVAEVADFCADGRVFYNSKLCQ